MTNLPIPSSNSQPASTNAVAGISQNSSDSQPANPFGAVLARQIKADEANASASNTPQTALGTEAKTTSDAAAQTGKTEQDKTLPPSLPNDPSSALAAMLQLPQEIKLPVTSDASSRGIADAMATSRGMTDAMATAGVMAGITMLGKANANTADANQQIANAGTIQGKTKAVLPSGTTGKVDVVATFADNLAAADKLPLRTEPGLEAIKSTALPGNLPDAARSAQGLAQTASSIGASGILPNMLTNDKNTNNLQTISSPLGSNGWADEFSQKITWMSSQQNQVVELHLNPPNLGPLDVVLKVSDNQATALFTSPHGAVRDAVENALPRLREMLADNGIMLGNTMVSDQPPRDRSADGFADNGRGTAAQRETSDDALKATGVSSAAAQTIPARRHNGMVDTFA